MLTYALLALNWIIVIAAFLFRASRRKLILLDPAWALLIGYFMNYCLKPALFLIEPSASVMYDYQTDVGTIGQQMAEPLAMALVFLICFLSVDLPLARRSEGALRASAQEIGHRDRAVYKFFSVLLILGGGVGFALFARKTGFTWNWTQLISGGARTDFLANNEGNGAYMFAMHLSQLGWCMFCFAGAFEGRKVQLGEQVGRSILFLFSLLVPLALGQRFGMVIVTTAATFLLGSSASRILSGDIKVKRLWWAVALAAITAGPVGLALKGRDFTFTKSIAMGTSAWDSLELHVIGETSGEWRLLYGKSYIEDLVYSYLPRTLLEKPERYGMRAVQDIVNPELESSGGTYPPGMVLEAYVNFGWLGVVGVPMLIAGCFVFVRRRLYRGKEFWLAQSLIIWVSVASFRGFGSVVAQSAADSVILAMVIGFSGLVASISPLRTHRKALPLWRSDRVFIGDNLNNQDLLLK